jgi:hypothetical protein
VLRDFASKRHVKLSRVTIRAKDEGEEAKPAAKHRRRRASVDSRGAGAVERKVSDRSLAKVRTPRAPLMLLRFPVVISNHLIRSLGLHRTSTTSVHAFILTSRPFSYAGRVHSLPFQSTQVMRRTEEVEPEPEPAGPSSSRPGATRHGNTDAAADLDAELDAMLVRRAAARQWRPALQSIAEG